MLQYFTNKDAPGFDICNRGAQDFCVQEECMEMQKSK